MIPSITLSERPGRWDSIQTNVSVMVGRVQYDQVGFVV